MNNTKSIPDADLSSAGDDFHVLYTIKKSLELLNFDERGLKAITVEGFENNASKKIDPTGEMFLGIDLTEYYGGKDFENSHAIIISQLKYSTRRVDENYTYSKLYEGKKSGSYNGSIIHRFATIYSAFLKEYGREQVLKKIKIKLVSNREFNSLQLGEIVQVQEFLATNENEINISNALDHFPSIKIEPFLKLEKATGLSSTEFTDFLKLLDFSDCGASSRRNLKFELITAIASTNITSRNQFNGLFQMVWSKMQPEKREERTIISLDIIGEFGLSSLDNLFPVSQNFEDNPNAVTREQLPDILLAIENNTLYRPICINGGAGMGKSTIVKQIKNNLPEYSECILFDCYGAGKYQNPEDKRHLHRNAIPQLANELAKNLGTDFLIVQNTSNDIYLNELIKRIRQGIEILKNRNPKASLTLIIDAADNSVTAANNAGEKSFVEDLLNIDIPEGCHIVVTTRNYRKESLNLPDKYVDIELNAFSLVETKLFLQSRFAENDENFVKEFHNYTRGIPRVQFYSLDLHEMGIRKVINYLKPYGKNVDDIILDKIKHAIKRIGRDKKVLVDQFFKLLISLPRPIPINYLADIMGVNEDFLKDLAADIWNGLIYEDKHFIFRDEDFENYIFENYHLGKSEFEEIAKLFIQKSSDDEYASVNLASILHLADFKKELVEIVLERMYLTFPLDPIRKKLVYVGRAKMALQASRALKDQLTFFKLLFITAAESKTDRAITELIIEYPDFVSRFGDEVSLSKLKLDSDEKPWAGAFHLKLAGINSRNAENREVSVKHLKTAREWLNWRRNVPKDKLSEYPISHVDIAYEFETELRLFGISSAIARLKGWRPAEVRLYAASFVADHLVRDLSPEQIREWLDYSGFRIDEKVFIVCKLFKIGRELNFDIKEMAVHLSMLLTRRKIQFGNDFKQILIDFCFILTQNEIDKNLIIEILGAVDAIPLEHLPYISKRYRDNRNEAELNLVLSKRALLCSLERKELNSSSFLPKRFDKIPKIKEYAKKNELENEQRRFLSFYKHAVEVFELHANICMQKSIGMSYGEKFNEICKSLGADREFRYLHGHRSDEYLIFFAGQLMKSALLLDNQIKYIECVLTSLDDVDQLQLRFEILDRIALHGSALPLVFKLLRDSDAIIDGSQLSSKEMIESYIKCLVLSSKVSDSYSRQFFDKAIAATAEIDYEANMKILGIYYLSAIGIPNNNPQLAYEFARFVEVCDITLRGYDKKHFPYSSALVAIGNLDPASMFSTLCRWHHVDITTIGENIISIIKHSVESGYLDHATASSILGLATNYGYDQLEDVYRLLISGFDSRGSVEQKNLFLKSLLRSSLIEKDKHTIRFIYGEIKSGKFVDREILDGYRKEVEIYDAIDKKKNETKNSGSFNLKDYDHHIDLVSLDFTNLKEVESAIAILMQDNTESHLIRWYIQNFLSDIVAICPAEKQIGFLNVLIAIDDRLLEFDSFEDILKKALKEWMYFPEVESWKKSKFTHIVLSKLPHFDYGNTLNIYALYEFAKLFDIDQALLSEVMVEVLTLKIDILSDESIYSSFELIKNLLNPSQNEELLEWVLKKWNAEIRPEIGEGTWHQSLRPVGHSNRIIASLLRFMLGHPDKKVRWQAIQSIRKSVNFGNIDVLSHLLDEQNNQNCHPFQHQFYKFYWMSAKLYLWIAIDRLVTESPQVLIEFRGRFLQELKNENLPHALIRYYIRKSCINLYRYDNTLFSDNEISSIMDSNQSRLDPINERQYSRALRRTSSGSEREWLFDFDQVDTLPYWYSNLGDVFNVSEYDVADIADKFITEDWGYTKEDRTEDYIKGQLSSRDYDLTRNDHGDNPEIEDLSIYFEYHAMFCAASVLLERKPLAENDSWNEWDEWLESHANSFGDFWLSDLADPVPVNDYVEKTDKKGFDEQWRDVIDEDYFDKKVGFLGEAAIEFITVYAESSEFIGPNEEAVSISSCIISEKGSDAFLRTLHFTEDSRDYYLPFELNDIDGSGKTNGIFNEDGFYFNGWLSEFRSEIDGLDAHESLYRLNSPKYIKFGANVEKHFNIQYDELFKKSYSDHEVVSISRNWNDLSDRTYRAHSENLEMSGFDFRVRKSFILNLLRKEQKCLVIKCAVQRQLKERIYKKMNHDDHNEVKLYLIKQDGTVKSLRGKNHRIG